MSFDLSWLAQLLGLLACAIGAAAFLQRQDAKLRLHLTLNGALLALHFLLLGATAAAINCLLCAVRTWISGYYRSIGVMLLFMLLAAVLVIPQLEHPIQWLTLIGTLLSTYALFRLQGMGLRLCMLASTLCWIVHNIWAGSLGGMLLEGMFLVINSYTIFSLYRTQRAISSTA
ncbi:YgjV family protein [Serratia microhaemolytica]|uniref:YgjV family protein n=1 Tax=Serratia microhaemolytica TaxID=2675110 RepID=UPI000FDE7455|nr:YgjV family protein [Serratia microhaemolytica]